jgi:hypothetical protein
VFNTDEEHQGLLFFGVFWSLTWHPHRQPLWPHWRVQRRSGAPRSVII